MTDLTDLAEDDQHDEARGPHEHDVEDSRPEAMLDRALIGYLQDELAHERHQVEQLEAALISARRIGAAIGIVMLTERVTEKEAFSTLDRLSQRLNCKLRVIADEIVRTGTY